MNSVLESPLLFGTVCSYFPPPPQSIHFFSLSCHSYLPPLMRPLCWGRLFSLSPLRRSSAMSVAEWSLLPYPPALLIPLFQMCAAQPKNSYSDSLFAMVCVYARRIYIYLRLHSFVRFVSVNVIHILKVNANEWLEIERHLCFREV